MIEDLPLGSLFSAIVALGKAANAKKSETLVDEATVAATAPDIRVMPAGGPIDVGQLVSISSDGRLVAAGHDEAGVGIAVTSAANEGDLITAQLEFNKIPRSPRQKPKRMPWPSTETVTAFARDSVKGKAAMFVQDVTVFRDESNGDTFIATRGLLGDADATETLYMIEPTNKEASERNQADADTKHRMLEATLSSVAPEAKITALSDRLLALMREQQPLRDRIVRLENRYIDAKQKSESVTSFFSHLREQLAANGHDIVNDMTNEEMACYLVTALGGFWHDIENKEAGAA